MKNGEAVAWDAKIEPIRKPAYTVGAAVNVVRILRYLGAQTQSVKLTRIATDLEINASTCLNILRTLADEGFVHQHVSGKTYALGLGLTEIARRALRQGEDLTVIQSIMNMAAQQRGLTLMLWTRVGNDSLTLAACTLSDTILQLRGDIGSRAPLLMGSMGRVMAAFGGLSEPVLRACFAKVEWRRPLDFRTYLEQVEQVRRLGWATDCGNSSMVRWGISVPVPNPYGPVERVLSTATLAEHFSPDELQGVASDLIDVARTISQGTPG